MTNKPIKMAVTIGGIVLAIVIFIVVIISYSLSVDSDTQKSSVKNTNISGDNNNFVESSSGNSVEAPSFLDKLVIRLKEKYGDTISAKSTQILLLKVKKNLLSKFPEKGLSIFTEAIKRAFPELADEILKTLAAMEAYLKWEKENHHLTAKMNVLEKQGFLWEKRKELFGDGAEEIWTDEVEAHDRRRQDMQAVITRLNNSDDAGIFEKLDDYQRSLNDIYENSPEAYILKSKDLLSKVFLSLDSVQDKLKEMTSEERKTELYNIRREMGYTQAQIEELEKIDEKKNSRWDNGLAYMDERETLTDSLEGEELDTALTALRQKYFQHEAKTIALEEESGFFRYTRKRIYGKN